MIIIMATAQFDTGSGKYNTGLPTADANGSQVQNILQVVIGIAAALAVLFIVIAGLRLVLAHGNAQDAAKARSMIIYAVVGLIVAISAEAIVSFALGNI